ncbi:hypothetical protein [Cohnella zeiphila]|uniref:Uncharacterized protein n=1 Tax=Cohnella zeiphila TaxID=2761120 RepID=A0A7X0SJ98_9BACL|nr:hypothetical protein [Cohnella zeiphila]MBB6730996.1 hypothetical protein [Cohnella zeiphila]
MRVVWHRPDLPPHEYDCSDVEQLLFLLRMVQTVYLQGEPYRLARSGLVVERDELSMALWLQNEKAPDEPRL